MSSSLVEIAQGLAARGFPVFPCGRKKQPAIAKKDGGKGFLDATSEKCEIDTLFARAPKAPLIGVPTGSVSGFDVLDVDYRNGGGAWEETNAHRLPKTRIHRTLSGGRHYVFLHAPGVRNSASKTTLAPGIDVRGDGGYVIFPPSPGYEILDHAAPADWPDWLLERVLNRPAESRLAAAHRHAEPINDRRLDGLVKSILASVQAAPDGAKHMRLRNAALSLGGIIDRAGISPDDAAQMLLQALPATVKDWDGARQTASWGVEQGRKRPIELSDRPGHRPGSFNPPANGGIINGHHPSSPQKPPQRPIIEDHRRSAIRVLAGLRHLAADQGIEALVTANVPFYQRDKNIVRVASFKAKTSDGQVIDIAAIVPVRTPAMTRTLGSIAEWERVKTDGEVIRVDPPKEVVEQIIAMVGEWPFEPLTGVISTPTMRPDGTILANPGYDHMTGLVMVNPPTMPAMPNAPTIQHANEARETLMDLLKEFPFADEAGKSVALSMILTSVLRAALGPAVPMHVVTAPQPGTGKSYLLDIASAIATGERCPVIAMAPNPEETEKRLVGAALAGQQIIAIDNVSTSMGGDFLNQVTERPIMLLRPLGTSETCRVPNTFTVFANGNNLSAPADLVRRTIVARLDANLENPEERTFEANPIRTILSDRGRYVAACLIIGRAYVLAKRPGKLPALPSFEPWSDLVRSALVWIGMTDPCKSMELARAEDPIKAAKTALFLAWEREIGLRILGLTTAELISNAEESDHLGFLCPTFREACLAVAADRTGTTISARRLGRWLSENEKNLAADLKLIINRSDKLRPRWVLFKVTAAPDAPGGT